jgi:hypothetical protein
MNSDTIAGTGKMLEVYKSHWSAMRSVQCLFSLLYGEGHWWVMAQCKVSVVGALWDSVV